MIKQKKNQKRIEIDLTGPQGNAFYLLGLAKRLSETMGENPVKITAEMKSGDYENLIKVFEREFGDVVVMYR